MTDVDNSSDTTGISPGQLLAQARERARLSHQDVAQSLHMSVTKVKAIEADEFNKMNADTFVRGYLRAYASLVKLDVGQVISAYEQQALAQGYLPPISQVPLKDSGGKKTWGFIVSLLIVLTVLLLISVWFFGNRITPSPSAGAPQPGPAPSLLTLPVPQAQQEGIEISTTETQTENGISDVATDGEASSPIAETAADLPPQTSQRESQTESALDVLQLHFTEECWLEVSDAQGDVLATDLQRPGSQLTLHGKAPFEVKLGNASAVRVLLNDEAVILTPPVGSRVLTLSIGE